MKDIHPDLAKALTKAGYQVEYPWNDRPVLLVNGACVIGDNLESSLGNIINLTADFNKMPFQELKEVGKIVRQNVDTSRVIAFGGPYTTIGHILSVVHEKIQASGEWMPRRPRCTEKAMKSITWATA